MHHNFLDTEECIKSLINHIEPEGRFVNFSGEFSPLCDAAHEWYAHSFLTFRLQYFSKSKRKTNATEIRLVCNKLSKYI